MTWEGLGNESLAGNISLVVVLSSAIISSLLCLLLLCSSGLSSLKGGVVGELNVLLRAHSDEVAGDVHKLFAHGDVSLSDEDSGVMDGVGDLLLGHNGLKSPIHELR